MDYIKVIVAAFIGGVIAFMLFLMFAPKQADMPAGATAAVDASTITNQFVFTKGIQIGTTATNRTLLNGVIATTCTGIVYASLGATTTAPIDCAVTGALTSAKFVSLHLPSGLPPAGINRNLIVSGGFASSTAGYITAYITNITGAATSSYPLATTSMQVLV